MAHLKQAIITEARKMMVISAFLFLFLGGFATYRRLILSEYHIDYFQYGYSLIEALVLAKVLLIGDLMHLGERFRHRPLIIPTLYKTLSFSIFVLVFALFEHFVVGLFQGKDLAEVVREFATQGAPQIFAKLLVMVVAFIPMFAVWEISRVLGEGKLFRLFFEQGGTIELAPPKGT
jgi:hypothetical protein